MPVAKLLGEFLTRAEMAKDLGKSVRTLERWDRLGIGPPVTRNGITPLYNVDSARAWLRAQEREVPRLILGLVLFFLVAISAGQPVAARQEVAAISAITCTIKKKPTEAMTPGGLILIFSMTPLTHRKDNDDVLIQTLAARV